jgi:GT2 family glycosyltransferase
MGRKAGCPGSSGRQAVNTPQILAVVVRYKTALEASQTIAGLSSALKDSELATEISVLVWDNSPGSLIDPQLAFVFDYGWSEQNLGTAGAYNKGIDLAERKGIPWMLLLDQDTDLTVDFLRAMIQHSRDLDSRPEVASVVPFIRSYGHLVSPRRFGRFNRSAPIERGFSGLVKEDAYAVNSASLMRVSALREIGGYSNDFWLDLSDVYAFQQLYLRGKRVYVAGELELNHAIAGMNFEREMVPQRYETFLAAESAYLQTYRSRFENIFQTLWLPLRALRQWREYRDKSYAKITWRYFMMRLTKRPSKRLQLWLDQLRRQRSIPVAR